MQCQTFLSESNFTRVAIAMCCLLNVPQNAIKRDDFNPKSRRKWPLR